MAEGEKHDEQYRADHKAVPFAARRDSDGRGRVCRAAALLPGGQRPHAVYPAVPRHHAGADLGQRAILARAGAGGLRAGGKGAADRQLLHQRPVRAGVE